MPATQASIVAGVGLPLQFAGGTAAPVLLRHATVRVRFPTPHVALHALHAPGDQPYPLHGVVLQRRDASGRVVVHSASPTTAPLELTHLTERVWVPPPHAAEHGEKLPATHAYVSQAPLLQASMASGRAPSQKPSKTVSPVLATHPTVRARTPSPQASEHAPNGPADHA